MLARDPQGVFATQALLCTDLERILSWFVLCWRLEVTFQEVRRRLGVETQRQWSKLAIRRTTPALLGLFSLAKLFAHQRTARSASYYFVRRAAWCHKPYPTFSDALALVQRGLWTQETTFYGSPRGADMVKVPRSFVKRLTKTVCKYP